jgi:hypothetical protein
MLDCAGHTGTELKATSFVVYKGQSCSKGRTNRIPLQPPIAIPAHDLLQ